MRQFQAETHFKNTKQNQYVTKEYPEEEEKCFETKKIYKSIKSCEKNK